MRRGMVAGLTALALAGCATSAPPSAIATAPATAAPLTDTTDWARVQGTFLRRATLVVSDMEKSIAFYEMVGFERWYDHTGKVSADPGVPIDDVKVGDASRLVIMKGAHPYMGMIGLLQQGEARPLPPPRNLTRGDAVLMMQTNDLARKAAAMEAAGYRIHQPLETARVTSVETAWDASFLMIFDPDGNLVELTERHN